MVSSKPTVGYPIDLLDYDLPLDLIAQTPLEERSASRLMHVHRKSRNIVSKSFSIFPELLNSGDVLVLNDSKVINGRIRGRKLSGGSIEILVLKELPNKRFEVITDVRGGSKVQDEYLLNNDFLVRVCEELGNGLAVIQTISVLPDNFHEEDFSLDSMVSIDDMPDDEFITRFYRSGEVPTPPYIKMNLDKPDRYQTVYANERGSAAAPTAGLHFTDDILTAIANRGVEIHKLTLHVGIGTFLPIRVDDLSKMTMHKEAFSVSRNTVNAIIIAKRSRRRIVAVGTTSARTLETVFQNSNLDLSCVPNKLSGHSEIFIYPGYEWRVVDAMLTNFHLPRSTLLAMIYSFGGRDLVRAAYDTAIKEKYRFFSFGDCMLIE